MDLYLLVRKSVFVEGRSRRETARLFGVACKTVDKMCAFSVPPGYRRKEPAARPKLDCFTGIIDQILTNDPQMPVKQRHTAKRIFERLKVEHGFTGGYTIIKEYVAEQRLRSKEMFVPLFGHREVLVKGFVDEVVIAHGNEVIARHPRSYDNADFVFDPLHYLALLEHKTGAQDQAAPLQGWQFPDVFAELRRLLEARMDKRGRREFVQVLRLLEVFPLAPVTAAIRDAIERGAIAFDAVKHLTLCRIEQRPPRLDLSAYPFLPGTEVKTTAAADYMALLGEAA